MSLHLFSLIAGVLIHAGLIVRVLLIEGRDPQSRLAWLMAILFLPIVGAVAYLIFGEPWVSSRFRRRANRVYKRLESQPMKAPGVQPLKQIPPHFWGAFRVCEALSQSTIADGNSVTLAPDANAAIAMMVDDIARAKDTVHISFYIWLTDNNGLKMVDAICSAAQRGVTCRIAADAIGSRTLIRSLYWGTMREAGAQLCASLSAPVGFGPLAPHRADLRNHRKIVVIDNTVTYCGSQNCADPAFLVKARFAPWVDIMLRITGPIAPQTQLIFASAWTVETGEDLAPSLAAAFPPNTTGDVSAIAFGTGPLSVKGGMSDAFCSLLYAAADEIVVSTPYFVPDPSLLAALVSAGRRGVATTLILPKRNDSRIIGAISRAFYAQLIAAGVRIFEYRGGLLHAKTLVVDHQVSLIGSANMDRRSLDLNFENNILLFSPAVSLTIRQRQDTYLAASHEIERLSVANRSVARRMAENIATMAGAFF